jgi:hypothetical protein
MPFREEGTVMEAFLGSLAFACLIAAQFLAVVCAYRARVRDRDGGGSGARIDAHEPQSSPTANARPVAIELLPLVFAPSRRYPLAETGGKLIPRFPVSRVLIKPVE